MHNYLGRGFLKLTEHNLPFVSAVPKFILTAVNPLVPDNKSSINHNDGGYQHRHRGWDGALQSLLKEHRGTQHRLGAGCEHSPAQRVTCPACPGSQSEIVAVSGWRIFYTFCQHQLFSKATELRMNLMHVPSNRSTWPVGLGRPLENCEAS